MTSNERALEVLKRRHPWPETQPDLRPIPWALDAGGKHLVLSELQKKPQPIVLEIGVFLGGSARLWLESNPNLHLIAVDPWPGNPTIGNFARRHGQPQWACDQLERDEDSIYETFMTNVWEHRQRIIPVRDYAPDALYAIADTGVQPDLIYLDGDKSGRELEVCRELFPNATITGDDWFFGSDRFFRHHDGYKIRGPVLEFCQRHDRYLLVDRATWVISPEPPSWKYRLTTAPRYHFKTARRRVRGAFRHLLGLERAA